MVQTLAPKHFSGKIGPRVHPCVYCSEACIPIGFIFDRYLSQDNRNPTPEGPHPKGSYGLGLVGKYRQWRTEEGAEGAVAPGRSIPGGALR